MSMFAKLVRCLILFWIVCTPVFADPTIGGAYDRGQIITNNLSALVGVPYVAFADNMREFIPAEYQADAATVFQKQWNSKTGKITFEGLLNVCVAGHITHCQEFPHSSHCAQEGYEIASIGHDTCIKFIQGIIKDARRLNRGKTVDAKPITRAKCKKLGGTWQDDGTGQELCLGKDGKHLAFSSSCDDGWGVCVSTFKDTQVQLYTALGLANAWGQRYDLTLTCEQEPETRSNQDYLRCSANGEAYEFEFDDVEESKDAWLDEGLEQALCTLYDLEYLPSGMSADTMVAPGESWPGACDTTDATVCDLIDKHAQTFGLRVNITNRKGALACVFSSVVGASMSNLRTAYGIDNMVFANTIQVEMTPALIEKIKQYVIAHMSAQNEPLIAFSCNYAPTSMLSKIGPFAGTDDVLTCYVNGQPVDFVFNDLSESKEVVQQGSNQAVDCIVSGGTFSGKRCLNLNQQRCMQLAKNNLASCPECKKIYWDSEHNVCTLPSAEKYTNLQRGINIALIAGGAVIAVGVTVATGGTGGAGIAVVMVETVGAGIELASQININHIADNFILESINCNNATCAEEMIKQNLQRMANYQNDFTAPEIDAIDAEMARLLNLIPHDSEFYMQTLGNITLESNQIHGWKSWENAQIWRAIGITMQLTGVISTIVTKILNRQGAKVFSKSVACINEKLRKSVDALSDTDRQFYELWREYGSRTQTLEDFKKLHNNDLDALRASVQNITPRSEQYKVFHKMREALEKVENALNKQNMSMNDIPENLAERYLFLKQHPELREIVQEMDDYTQAVDVIYAWDAINDVNSDEVADILRQVEDLRKPIDTEYQSQTAKIWADFDQGRITQSEKDARITEANQRMKSRIENEISQIYQPMVATQVKMPTLDAVVEERVVMFANIVDSDSELKQIATNWGTATKKQKTLFAQKVLDQANKQVLPKGYKHLQIQLTNTHDDGAGGLYNSMTHTISIDPHETHDLSRFMEILAHEHAHAVDDITPTMGALGQQKSKLSATIYSSDADKGYWSSLTEQSSHKIGPAVANQFKPMHNYSRANAIAVAGIAAGLIEFGSVITLYDFLKNVELPFTNDENAL